VAAALTSTLRAPFAHATVAELATLPGVTHASKSSVQRAIERLQGRNILARHQRDYRFDDVLFLHWLRETDLAKVFQ
jgi:predicted transcriptional regulator